MDRWYIILPVMSVIIGLDKEHGPADVAAGVGGQIGHDRIEGAGSHANVRVGVLAGGRRGQIVVRFLARAGGGIQIGPRNASHRGRGSERANEVLIADDDAAFQHDVAGIGALNAAGVPGVHIEILRQHERQTAGAPAGHPVGAVSLQPKGRRKGAREQGLIAGRREIDSLGAHLADVVHQLNQLDRADHADADRRQ